MGHVDPQVFMTLVREGGPLTTVVRKHLCITIVDLAGRHDLIAGMTAERG
jgi:hypothetical protein